MPTLIKIDAETKRALMQDASDIAAAVVRQAAVDERTAEALADYATICRIARDTPVTSETRSELERIKVGLIAELRRAVDCTEGNRVADAGPISKRTGVSH